MIVNLQISIMKIENFFNFKDKLFALKKMRHHKTKTPSFFESLSILVYVITVFSRVTYAAPLERAIARRTAVSALINP